MEPASFIGGRFLDGPLTMSWPGEWNSWNSPADPQLRNGTVLGSKLS